MEQAADQRVARETQEDSRQRSKVQRCGFYIDPDNAGFGGFINPVGTLGVMVAEVARKRRRKKKD